MYIFLFHYSEHFWPSTFAGYICVENVRQRERVPALLENVRQRERVPALLENVRQRERVPALLEKCWRISLCVTA